MGHFRWLFLSVRIIVPWFDEITVQYWAGICRDSLLDQLGWFLLRRVVDLPRVRSLHISNRNHSDRFLMI